MDTPSPTQEDKPLKIGLIGCGRATETRHLPTLAGLSNVEVVGLADVCPGPLHQLGERFGVQQRYEDYRRLLDDPSIAAVAICVPALAHADVAHAALKAGKHVLIEKPLALNFNDTQRIIWDATELPHLKVMVGLNMRWHRLIRQARSIIKTGALGKIESMRSVLTSYHASVPDWGYKRSSGGGALFELAVHHIDLWRYLLDCEVDEVFAQSRSARWEDEYVAVTARMSDGTQVSSVFAQTGSELNTIEIYGESGGLSISCYEFDGLEYLPRGRYPGDMRARLSKASRLVRELPRGLRTMLRGGEFFASYRAEWQHFLNAVQSDAVITEGTLRDGHHSLAVVLAAIASSRQGTTVSTAEALHSDSALPPRYSL